ncbi:hypothetical protein [Methanobrevibacter arboriphilus]|uniref:hypothetical protein n=1 Tax=Methanobrevibacter arboriphilus TaxID=39441 RepID=UPI0012DC3DD9|nr:hypothetical protein [Methanobrevibacter arboriphilus]
MTAKTQNMNKKNEQPTKKIITTTIITIIKSTITHNFHPKTEYTKPKHHKKKKNNTIHIIPIHTKKERN